MKRDEYILLFDKYLRNEATHEEQELLTTELSRDERFQQILEKHLELASPLIENGAAERLFSNICAQTNPPKRVAGRSLLRKSLQWAAFLLLPLISALAVYYFMGSNLSGGRQPVTVSAAKGEKAHLTLADGSHVWINSGSSVTYDDGYNRNNRKILLTGEAFFEVAKEKRLPFIVETKGLIVRATGTSFNVKDYDDDMQATSVLLEGEIEVSALGTRVLLHDNERATLDKELHTLQIDVVNASDFVQWTNGHLFFVNLSFEEIAKTLSRVFNVDIRFASDRLRTIRFSGTLSSSSILNALDLLSITSPMRYEINSTTIELYYRE